MQLIYFDYYLKKIIIEGVILLENFAFQKTILHFQIINYLQIPDSLFPASSS